MANTKDKPEVWVVTTGFGPFGNVGVNPTDLIMRALQQPEALASFNSRLDQIRPGSKVFTCRTLEVSVKATAAALDAIRAQVAEELAKTSKAVKVLYVHFGVDEGAMGFLLESKAYNEADFVVDMRGHRAVHEPIVKDKSIEFCYTSNFALNDLARFARDTGYLCDVSMDAGRYLCNFIYFSSLLRCEGPNEDAMFIHVPPQTRMPMLKQVEFAQFIITQLVSRS